MFYYLELESPVGPLLLESDGRALMGLWMGKTLPEDGNPKTCPVLTQVRLWLEDYFRGRPRDVDFPLAPRGTAFQKMVWEMLLKIPYGQTRTYGDLAAEAAAVLGKEKMSAQAIGGAVGKNPISIIIPCHRVVGVGGKLTGYAWGIPKKAWLLKHEGTILVNSEE